MSAPAARRALFVARLGSAATLLLLLGACEMHNAPSQARPSGAPVEQCVEAGTQCVLGDEQLGVCMPREVGQDALYCMSQH